jgi:DNA-binding transcriptional ArsR family regulator
MKSMDRLVSLFKALSNEHRIKILQILREPQRWGKREDAEEMGGVCVCHIQEALKLAISTTSQHLKILKQAGLIRSKKRGKWTHYSIDEKKMAEFREFIGQL